MTSDNYCFQPGAIETTSVYGKSSAPFLSHIAKKRDDRSDDLLKKLTFRSLLFYLYHGATVTPPALVPGCGQRGRGQYTSLCARLI